MSFDLTALIDRVRRASSDWPRFTTDMLVGTGDATLALNNAGGITLISVQVDGENVPLGSVSFSDNTLTFSDPPQDSANVVVNYSLTRFTDDQIKNFIADAAIAVGGDLGLQWTVDVDTLVIDEIPLKVCNEDQKTLQYRVQTAIVYRAAVDIVGDKVNQAADKAILVKDGDTTIDTSKMAHSGERAMGRVQARYDEHLKHLRPALHVPVSSRFSLR